MVIENDSLMLSFPEDEKDRLIQEAGSRKSLDGKVNLS